MEPGFLVASPQLRDPNFQRTVVLLLRHDEQGAIGVVVNRESPMRLSDVLERLEGMPPARFYQPVERGLEIRIAEKLRQLRALDDAASDKPD